MGSYLTVDKQNLRLFYGLCVLLSVLLLTPASAQSLFKNLPFSTTQPELLRAEQAFIPSVQVTPDWRLEARLTIAEGYYLYRDKLHISLVEARDLQLGSLQLPPGTPKEDEFFGVQQVYHGEVLISAALDGQGPSSREVQVKLEYQGCAEAGVCYPPLSQTLPVLLPKAAPATPANATPLPATAPESEQDRLTRTLAEQGYWALPLFFGLGLLLAFTPCMFPMIPILSGVIVGQQARPGSRRALMLSLVYVLAMSLTYTVAGLVAAQFGQNLPAWFQNPWVLSTFAGLFVLLALSMFGLFDLQLPTAWQSYLAQLSSRQEGGRYWGAASMGVFSALIVGPCVAPPLIGVLGLIAHTGDLLLGGTALFVLSFGMGVPLLLLGASAGHWLPKSGPWLERIKHVFGVLLLAVALWLLERILPTALSMLGWALLLMAAAVQCGALHPLAREASPLLALGKGLGILLLVYACLILVGLASGGQDPWQPLRTLGVAKVVAGTTQQANFQTIKSVAELELALSHAQGRPVVLDFYADWCVSCKELEKYTFTDVQVQQAWANAVKLRADVTANDALDQALLAHFKIIGPPALLFFDTQGQEQPTLRVVGFMPAPEFAQHLQRVMGS